MYLYIHICMHVCEIQRLCFVCSLSSTWVKWSHGVRHVVKESCPLNSRIWKTQSTITRDYMSTSQPHTLRSVHTCTQVSMQNTNVLYMQILMPPPQIFKIGLTVIQIMYSNTCCQYNTIQTLQYKLFPWSIYLC